MIQLCLLALILALANDQFIPAAVDASGSFNFVNKCKYTIWPVISSTGSETLSTTGFVLQQGGSKTIQGVKSWNGRFWARTQCSQDSTGKFTCLTGDCGSGKIECNGGKVNGPLTVTLAEFGLGVNGDMDFYAISLVDGYNLPLLVVPQGGSGANCLTTGCTLDLNGGTACPSELKLTNALGDGVACQSACTVFKTDEYCCTGAYSTPDTCKPTDLSRVFKNACPRAYSYAFDDATSTSTCTGSPDYSITFCPSPATSPAQRIIGPFGVLRLANKGKEGHCHPFQAYGSPNASPGGDGDSNSRNNNSYYLPFVNGTVGYDGATDVNSGGASTCIHVLRSQLIARAVAIATTVWWLCQHL